MALFLCSISFIYIYIVEEKKKKEIQNAEFRLLYEVKYKYKRKLAYLTKNFENFISVFNWKLNENQISVTTNKAIWLLTDKIMINRPIWSIYSRIVKNFLKAHDFFLN